MQKHAMALGYFLLAVFCVYTSAQGFVQLRLPLLVAAAVAALMGFGFLLCACAVQLQTGKNWLVQLVRLAQQPPVRESKSDQEHVV